MTSSINRIQILPPTVAERIAAGEVIERPSSVVKELVENSIDAGATEIAITLEDGGKQLIEVLDNGMGMNAEDLRLSVQRHATSKLKTLAELERIQTLGFRGEALPSIAAVSDLKILSRTAGAESAYELSAATPGMVRSDDDLSKKTYGHFLNSPHGTRIQARGLFSQVPARLKFLKTQASEVSQVREWIERVALAHPQIGFKLISNDRTLLSLRPESAAERVQSILAEGDSFPLVQAESQTNSALGAFSVRLYWFQGMSTPSTRKLLQVVNGRSVRDKLLQQAIMSAFRQSLLPGQFPAAALFIEIDPAALDVNVHPTKAEVRFLNSREIFRAVESLVEASVVKHGAPTYATSTSSVGMQALEGFRASEPQNLGFSGPTSNPLSREPAPQTPTLWTLNSGKQGPGITPHPLSYSTFVGTLFGTYFIYDDRSELVLVDQHAAHERIRYEKLKKRVLTGDQSVSSQILLVPESVKYPTESRPLIEARLSLLLDLGFEVEFFSEDTLLFRSIPSEWSSTSGHSELGPRLKSLVERLIQIDDSQAERGKAGFKPILWDESLFEKIASEACHSAIRAGDRVDPLQAQELVKQLFFCEHPWNCPHGRPTVVRIPRGKLEEWFQRRV